ncbi:helix-turn-helix domain-containing protein [Modestobacter sp. I12A-02662]|uniref:helix-turn-helix domain-containing protein n=1 Tax=Modestobacter sp. I12A-02662 TaxID=1730496 RepID=UPI0034DFE9F6
MAERPGPGGPTEPAPTVAEPVGAGQVAALMDALISGREFPSALVDRIAGHGSAADAADLRRRVAEARTTIDRWRRRDQQLSALFSSARELAELRDVDPLLDRLVERAHDLVGSDLMYLSEFDAETGDLHVRSTLGAVTEAFRHLRVPAGTGLASKVVQARAPRWQTDYFVDADVRHDPGIDAAVAGEGLVSLLGIPMLAGDEVLGVLFAAYRSGHSFTTDEIALLSAFADHAAVVLQTAELFAIAHRSTREAEKALAESAHHVAAMERAGLVHEELTSVVLGGGDAGGIAATLSRALRRSVVITDRSAAAVAATDAHGTQVAPAFRVSAVITEALDESRRSGHFVELPESEEHHGLTAAVAGRSLLGAIGVGRSSDPFGPVEKRIVERAGLILALQTLQQDAFVRAEERVRGELLADLLDPARAADPDVRQRARARRVDLQELRVPIAVHVPDDVRDAALRVVQDPALASLSGERGQLVAVLSSSEDGAAAGELIARRLAAVTARQPLVIVGRSGPADRLAHRWAQVQACARLLERLDVRHGLVSVDAYAPYLAVFGNGDDDVQAYIRHLIGPVLDWDAQRGTDLLRTVAAYLDCQSSPAATARSLGVHVNTVLQRLARLDELLGGRWRSPEVLFRLSIAVRLHLVARSAATTGGRNVH